MSNILKIRDYTTLAEVGTISNVINPLVSETINDAYTLNFETIYDSVNNIISAGKIIEVDNNYFQIMVMSKSLSRNYRVIGEHVSYGMNHINFQTTEYEGTAHEILSEMFNTLPIHFRLGNVAATESKYLKTSTTDSLRKCIIMVANLFGLEIIWDKFTTHLVERRGADNGLEFKLGENLVGVTETYDLTDDIPEPSYQVDVIDLSELEGYEEFASIGLGDTVKVIASNINLDVSKRIVKRDFNPFSRANVQVDIGQVVRDFTDYIRDEKEEEEEEDEDENKTMLANFKVGDIDCLKLDSIDETSAVIDFITNTAVQGIDASNVVELPGNKTGVSASIDSQHSGYILTALITSETENGTTTTQYVMPNASLNTLSVPGNNESVSVTIVVTKIPFADLMSNPSAFEGETPPFIEAYGVKFIINNNADGFLESFQVGDVDCLSLGESIDETGQIISYMKGTVSNPVAGEVYKTFEQLKGINAKLKEKVKGHHLTLIHSVKGTGEEGTWTHTTRTMPIANARDFKVPTNEDDSVILVITKEPFDSIKNGTVNVEETFIVAFGVRFTEEEILSDDTYRMEFGICDLGGMMTFDFEYKDGYGKINSITTGIIGDDSTSGDIKLVAKAEKTGDKYKRIKIFAIIGDGVNFETTKVSIQAVCYTGTHEVMG